jgi:hypothetical protein
MPNAAVRSHTQDSPPGWQAIIDSSRSRTGSATAFEQCLQLVRLGLEPVALLNRCPG